MRREYIRRFRVRHYELDRLGHVNNAVYVKYMQEAAIEASTDAGFSPAWYVANGTGWVIRKLDIRYYRQLRYRDELAVRTWVSDIQRVSSHREYEITRLEDGAPVARARVNWIYVDLKTRRPARIAAEFHKAFSPDGELEQLDIRIPNAQVPDNAYRYQRQRRVEFYEVDTAQHVHHAVYLEWIQQAYFDAIRAAGYPVEKASAEGLNVLQGGHSIEYYEPAFDDDAIEVTSWICELGKVRGAWIHEIRNGVSGKLLARDYSLGIFVNAEGRLIAGPDHIVGAVVRGPTSKSAG